MVESLVVKHLVTLFQQTFDRKRFLDILNPFFQHTVAHNDVLRVAGHIQHLGLGMMFADIDKCLRPFHSRHDDVREHQMDGAIMRRRLGDGIRYIV